MASIKKTNTRPEIYLRLALWKIGVRGWRCHMRSLPGTPDIAFPRWRLAVHVDGVWWHGHRDYFTPGKRGPYWDTKIARNKARDIAVDEKLVSMNWRSVRIWDIDVLASPESVAERVVHLLRQSGWPGPKKVTIPVKDRRLWRKR